MLRHWKNLLAGAALLSLVPFGAAFTLLGPGGAEGITAKQWQLPGQNSGWDIGYNQVGDIGAPVGVLEAYRWNVPVLTYAFDESFVRFFGSNGVKAVDAAIRIINELPAASRMSADLSEFPLNTMQLNYRAGQLGLIDLKSVALTALLEEMGLTDPVRWSFAIRERIPILPPDDGVYTIVKYNFDPVTLQASSYVNGTLWTYVIDEFKVPKISDAREVLPPNSDFTQLNYPVAARDSTLGFSGYYFTGLTRDDAGALRYLYRPRNVVTETLPVGTQPASGRWIPYIGTNFLGSNIVVTNITGGTNNIGTAGIRGGVDKIRFQKVFFDSVLGTTFTPITNVFTDRVMTTNNRVVVQKVARPILEPDIVFTVEDIGTQFIYRRTTTAAWSDNDLINGRTLMGGPGNITGPVEITFNSLYPNMLNITPFFVTEPDPNDFVARAVGLFSPTWASYDGTTNAPIIYPQYLNFNSLQFLIGGGQ